MERKYKTTNKYGEKVTVDEDTFKQLIDLGKKRASDFTTIYSEDKIRPPSYAPSIPGQVEQDPMTGLKEGQQLQNILKAPGTVAYTAMKTAPQTGTFGNRPVGYEDVVDMDLDFKQSYENVSEGKDPVTAEPSLMADIASDPSNIPTMVAGGPLLKGATKATSLLKKSKPVTNAIARIMAGSGEGALSAGMHQSEEAVEGGEASLGSAITETGASGLLPVAIEGIAKSGNKMVGGLLSVWTQLGSDVLRTAGRKEGAKKLSDAVMNKGEFAKEAVDYLKTYDDSFIKPAQKKVEDVVSVMPNISLDNTKKALNDAMKELTLEETHAPIRNQLRKVYNDIVSGKQLPDVDIMGYKNVDEPFKIVFNSLNPVYSIQKPGKPYVKRTVPGKWVEEDELPAEQFYNFRKALDSDLIDWNKAGAKKKARLLKDIRKAMKEDLSSVGDDFFKGFGLTGDIFSSLMDDFASKINKKKHIEKLFSLNESTNYNDPNIRDGFAKRMDQIINQKAHNKDRIELLDSFDELLNGQLGEKMKLMNKGLKLGPEGKASYIPRRTLLPYTALGAGAVASAMNPFLSPIMFIAGGSSLMSMPKVAAKTLGSMDATGDLYKRGLNAVPLQTKVAGKQIARTATFGEDEE